MSPTNKQKIRFNHECKKMINKMKEWRGEDSFSGPFKGPMFWPPLDFWA